MTTPNQMRRDRGEHLCDRLIVEGERLALQKLPTSEKLQKRRNLARRAWEEIERLLGRG